ncbi:hypothetical protein K505DRAFT_366678 [Melanomma pulvis-pyrius CBS 109.77]|uniref:Uncharacterized protein n=1 Tax=Melanomma pulvis-pyrius CBS 109.77 TaxID=1314802 RepID=A0A6A6WWC1_9PLEO|nr:hypothetical protein K505DRAFT_366678 [Melanomma pulvis-pyrius CBS 109.77]
MAPKAKTITISGPFDARHVGGIGIPGVTNPVGGIQQSYTSIQPDLIPTHSFAATGTSEITKPKRANTIASTLSRPSLHLKTSISRLRARSSSNSPDTYRRRERDSLQEEDKENEVDMSTASLRKKPSISRLRERAKSNPADQARRQRSLERDTIPEAAPAAPAAVEKQLPPLRLRSSMSRMVLKTTTINLQDHSHRHQQQVQPSQTQIEPPRTVPAKKQPPTRPKRADSGTAIDFTHVSREERPMGFKEIIAVSSFEQRMALYKKTREYWATADHGLDEWVGKAGTRRPMASLA